MTSLTSVIQDTVAPNLAHHPIGTTKAALHRIADSKGWYWGTGRRKTATARVRIRPGTGEFLINETPLDEFFVADRDRKSLEGVMEKCSLKGKIDVRVNVLGGGCTGQAGAVLMGLARSLFAYDLNLEPVLRDNGYLTRDSRKVERKKYGQSGARRRFQFSKR
ncbi:MAG: 30S ribosomal protein S9 [Phycisphaerales bacterium]|nr:30S ribosomal protein S9 [Phycisphaerales bacterium]